MKINFSVTKLGSADYRADWIGFSVVNWKFTSMILESLSADLVTFIHGAFGLIYFE